MFADREEMIVDFILMWIAVDVVILILWHRFVSDGRARSEHELTRMHRKSPVWDARPRLVRYR